MSTQQSIYPSALLLNFPFQPIQSTSSSSDSDSHTTDISLLLLSEVLKYVRSYLYIHLVPPVTTLSSLSTDIPADWSSITLDQLQNRLANIYAYVAGTQTDVDVRVILPSTTEHHETDNSPRVPNRIYIEYSAIPLLHPNEVSATKLIKHQVISPISISVIFASDFSFEGKKAEHSLIGGIRCEQNSLSNTNATNSIELCPFLYSPANGCFVSTPSLSVTFPTFTSTVSSSFRLSRYQHVVLGGTFDHLHVGHKLLLSTAAALSSKKVTVGVTSASMLTRKTLSNLIQPIQERILNVHDILRDMKSELEYQVVEITTPEGPAVEDSTMQCIIISDETRPGADSINRQRSHLSPPNQKLDVVTVPTIQPQSKMLITNSSLESKLSSTAARVRLLGTYIGRSHPYPHLSGNHGNCYVIGLTGGMASGKSSVAGYLSSLGAIVFDCDRLAHTVYQPGEAAYNKIIEVFGKEILTEEKLIDRKKLGSAVFPSTEKNEVTTNSSYSASSTQILPRTLATLNSIVWPALYQKVEYAISKLPIDSIAIIDAAVLLEAGWADHSNSLINEIWICFVPPGEAISRIQKRNGLSAEEAERRLKAQISVEERLKRADVLLSTIFEVEETHRIVARAWELLLERVEKWKFTGQVNVLQENGAKL